MLVSLTKFPSCEAAYARLDEEDEMVVGMFERMTKSSSYASNPEGYVQEGYVGIEKSTRQTIVEDISLASATNLASLSPPRRTSASIIMLSLPTSSVWLRNQIP